MQTRNRMVLVGFGLAWIAAVASAQEKKPADPVAKPKSTYQEHVQAIFREHCFTCHSADQAKGGLALDSYTATMRGGAGGEAIIAGDLESSRLWALVAHLENPKMPPEQDKLPDAKLNVIKQWILEGALENAGSKVATQKKPSLELKGFAGSGKPSGPPPMPEGLPHEPFVSTNRPGAITALAASPWAPLVAVGGQKQVMLHHADSGELLGILPFPEGTPHVIKFSRSGTVLLVGGGRGGLSGKVVLFEVKSGKRLAEVGDELDVVLAADVNDDLTIVAMGGPRKVLRLYYVADGSEVCPPIRKHTDWIYSIEFSPDGVLLATSDRSGGLVVWEGDTGREFHNLVGHRAGVTDVSWRSDSNVVASASEDGTIKQWEMDNGREIRSFQGAEGSGVLGVEFAKDGRLVSVGRSKKAYLWAADGKQIRQYPGFADLASEVAISHDGKRIVAGDLQGDLRLFDADSDKLLTQIAANPPTLDIVIQLETEKASVAEKVSAEADAARKSALATVAAATIAADKLAALNAEIAKLEAVRADIEKQVATAAVAVKPAADKVAALLPAANNAKQEADEAAKVAASKAAAAKAAADQVAAAKLESDKAVAAKTAADKALSDATASLAAAKGKVPAEKAAADKLAADKLAAEKLAAEKTVAAKSAADQASAAKARLERAKVEKANLEKNRTAQAGANQTQASAK